MVLKNPLILSVLLTGILITACKRDPEIETVYDVPEIVQPYIDQFEIEAAARGYNITIDSLIVDFGSDLRGGDAAGLCRFANSQDPIPHITLDTNSFNWQNNESHREVLIFHELGHCILERRQHTDNVMPNGNFSSIMRSIGDMLYGQNLNAFKREYYIDELFNPGTPYPDWALDFPTYNSSNFQRVPIFTEDFDDNRNVWIIQDEQDVRSEISDGKFTFEAKSEVSYFTRKLIDFDETRDFEIETEIRIVNGPQLAMVQWGGNDNRDFSFYGFTQDSVGVIGNWESGLSIIRELFLFDPALPHKLTIRKIADKYHFYLNEQYFDVMEYEIFSGRQFAFFVGAFTTMEVEYLYVNYLN